MTPKSGRALRTLLSAIDGLVLESYGADAPSALPGSVGLPGTGGAAATPLLGGLPAAGAGFLGDQAPLGDDDQPYDELELRMAKRFIELVGSPDRARELIDRCDEYMEGLGLLDDGHDDGHDDAAAIAAIGQAAPDAVSEPTGMVLPGRFSTSEIHDV